jgi:uncharacterized membrane protein
MNKEIKISNFFYILGLIALTISSLFSYSGSKQSLLHGGYYGFGEGIFSLLFLYISIFLFLVGFSQRNKIQRVDNNKNRNLRIVAYIITALIIGLWFRHF